MIELKDAISKAKDFINDINGRSDDAQVEEAFISTDETYWAVAVSYVGKDANGARITKMVHVDANTGKINGMYSQA